MASCQNHFSSVCTFHVARYSKKSNPDIASLTLLYDGQLLCAVPNDDLKHLKSDLPNQSRDSVRLMWLLCRSMTSAFGRTGDSPMAVETFGRGSRDGSRGAVLFIHVARFVLVAEIADRKLSPTGSSAKFESQNIPSPLLEHTTHGVNADISLHVITTLKESLLEIAVFGVDPLKENVGPRFGLPSSDSGLAKDIWSNPRSSLSSCTRLNSSMSKRSDSSSARSRSVSLATATQPLGESSNKVHNVSHASTSREPVLRRAAKSLFSKQSVKHPPLILTAVPLSSCMAGPISSDSSELPALSLKPPNLDLQGVVLRACVAFPVDHARTSRRSRSSLRMSLTQLLVAKSRELRCLPPPLVDAIVGSFAALLTSLDVACGSKFRPNVGAATHVGVATSVGASATGGVSESDSKTTNAGNKTIADSNLWTTNAVGYAGSKDVSTRFSVRSLELGKRFDDDCGGSSCGTLSAQSITRVVGDHEANSRSVDSGGYSTEKTGSAHADAASARDPGDQIHARSLRWFVSRGRIVRSLHTAGESMLVLVCACEDIARDTFEQAFQPFI